MKLLIDHNLSPKLAKSLQILFEDDCIEALRDRFAPDVPDVHWITSLDAEGGWAVLTKDLRIRTRPHERRALDQSRIVFFFLARAWRKYDVAETASRLIRLVPLMRTQAEIAEQGRFDLPINRSSKLRPHRD